MAGDTLVIETNGGQVLELPRQTAVALLRSGFAKRAQSSRGWIDAAEALRRFGAEANRRPALAAQLHQWEPRR